MNVRSWVEEGNHAGSAAVAVPCSGVDGLAWKPGGLASALVGGVAVVGDPSEL